LFLSLAAQCLHRKRRCRNLFSGRLITPLDPFEGAGHTQPKTQLGCQHWGVGWPFMAPLLLPSRSMNPAGVVVWFTGLPASGKTTLARRTATRFSREKPILLDSDKLRTIVGPALGYDSRARGRFYRALAELAALLARQGHLVLVAATAHRRSYRAYAKELAPRFIEVFIDLPLATCARRDAKGLYRLAAKGKARSLPGVGAPYQPPLHPDVVARGGRDRAAVDRLLSLLGKAVGPRRSV
jgi:adenylylsulfate kinase